MEQAVFEATIEDLEKLTTPLAPEVKKVYYESLKRWPASHIERAAKTLVQTYRAKRFPSVAVFRRVLDHIELESVKPPVTEPPSPYDNLPCPACNDTGFQLKDNKNYKLGEDSCLASFCVCNKGRRIEEGWRAYRDIQKRVEQKRRERRDEVPDIYTNTQED